MSLDKTRKVILFSLFVCFSLIPNPFGKAGDLKRTTTLNHFYSLIHPHSLPVHLPVSGTAVMSETLQSSWRNKQEDAFINSTIIC